MEMVIANHYDKSFSTYEFKNDKGDFKKSYKPPKDSTKEGLIVSTREPVRILGKPRLQGKKALYSKEMTKKHPMLKDL